MIGLQWIIMAADAAITLSATLNSLALGRIGRMKSQKRPLGINYPPLTIVVTAHNQAEELRKHLPTLLLQDYPSEFEVVVVDMASTDETLPMLEKMEEEYPSLRHTFTPDTARDISLERLALTLGIRSASFPWTILLHAGCRPASPYWLRRMGEAMLKDNDTRIVVAPVCPDHSEKGDEYTTMWNELLWLSYAAKHGAYRTGACNVAYRRDLFMQHHGFASHSLLAGGAIDIMVNHHSVSRNTAVTIRPESLMLYTPVTEDSDAHIMYMETRRHLKCHHLFRIQYAMVAAALPASLLSAAATMTWMALHAQWWLMSAAALLMTMQWGMYHRAYARSVRVLGLQAPNPFAHLRAILIPLADMRAWIRHRIMGSKTFRKKFV